MRLLLCLNNDFLANYALNLVWEDLCHHQLSIALSGGIGAPGTPKASVFQRWGTLERNLVHEALFPEVERRNMARRGVFRTFGQLAASQGGEAPVFSSITGPEAQAYVSAAKPDLIVSVRYGHIFKPPLISIPRYGILNLHSGLLPEYRGIYAPFWAMLNRERHIGATLHYVRDAGIDTGDVVEAYRMPADYGRSVIWNIAMLYHGAMRMIPRALEHIEREGSVPSAPQSADGAAYYPFPLDEDIARFERQGGRLYEERDYPALFEPYGVATPCLQTA